MKQALHLFATIEARTEELLASLALQADEEAQERVERLRVGVNELSKHWNNAVSARRSSDDERYLESLEHFFTYVCFSTTSWWYVASNLAKDASGLQAIQQVEAHVTSYWCACEPVLTDLIACYQRHYQHSEALEESPCQVKKLVQVWSTVAHMVHSATTTDAIQYVFWAVADEHRGLDALEHKDIPSAFDWYKDAIFQWEQAADMFFEAADEPANPPLCASDYNAYAIACMQQMQRLWTQASHLLPLAYASLYSPKEEPDQEATDTVLEGC